MVTLPEEFIATKFPGYFWNSNTQSLYSIKVTGVLQPLKYEGPNKFNHFLTGYRVSVKGKRRVLTLEYLKSLRPSNQVIPVQKQK